MSQVKPSFTPEDLEKRPEVKQLYELLYQGMLTASQNEAPSFVDNPPMKDGQIDTQAINDAIKEYSDVLMKNSAYLFADSIVEVVGLEEGGEGSLSSKYISKQGDSMQGLLKALNGFKAGLGNAVVLEIFKDSNQVLWTNLYGNQSVEGDVHIDGGLYLSTQGINLNGHDILSLNEAGLLIKYTTVNITGAVTVDGSLQIGDLQLSSDGIKFKEYEYYHSGNSNVDTVNWTMLNGNVAGDLTVDGNSVFQGALTSNGGFKFTASQHDLLYSQVKQDGNNESVGIVLNTDLSIINNYGIKFGEQYIVTVSGISEKFVSFQAPGMVMNVGSSDTTDIRLQKGISNATGGYVMVSSQGDGNFPNSLTAGCGNAAPTVIQTYFNSKEDCGVKVNRNLRFGENGPLFYNDTDTLTGVMPYSYIDGDVSRTENLKFNLSYTSTTSPFRNLSINSATLQINTDAEFIALGKPVESPSFCIKSEKYKTRLIENALFLGDEKFIEGIEGGLRYVGNAVFTKSLSSPEFASGFAGYGWGIMHNETFGGFAATFDELTVRKKWRAYELEVQKISVTNGSLWVSDSCSGDEVIAL